MSDIIPSDTPQKQCTKCKLYKPATVDYFHANKNLADGLHLWCKTCKLTYDKVPPEKNRITQRKYDAAHKAEKRLYAQTHPEVIRAGSRNHQARKKNNGGTHTAQDIQAQYRNQRGKCYYCKVAVGKRYDVDHVVPLVRGGSNDPSNLVISCPSCNRSKSSKLPHEWPQGNRLL